MTTKTRWTVDVVARVLRTFEVEASDYSEARRLAHGRMLETDLGRPEETRVSIDEVLHHAPATASDYIHCVGNLVVVTAAVGRKHRTRHGCGLRQSEVDAALAAAEKFGELEYWNGVGAESLSIRWAKPAEGHGPSGSCGYPCGLLAPRVSAIQAALDAEWLARPEADR